MIYEELEAPPNQRDIIACYWRFEVEKKDSLPFDHLIVPDGTVSLSYFEDGQSTAWRVMIAGPGVEARKVHIAGVGRWIGIRLRAGVVRPVLGFAASELHNRSWPLEPLQPVASELRAALVGCTRLTDATKRLAPYVERWIAAARPVDKVVVAAARAIADAGGHLLIGELAASLRLGPRQLRRRFTYEVGLTPKEFARARRARRVFVEALRKIKSHWSDLSNQAGYADQAHLARDFRSIFGMPPQVIDAYIRSIRHERIVDV